MKIVPPMAIKKHTNMEIQKSRELILLKSQLDPLKDDNVRENNSAKKQQRPVVCNAKRREQIFKGPAIVNAGN